MKAELEDTYLSMANTKKNDRKDKMQETEKREEERRPSEDTTEVLEDDEKDISVWKAIRRYPKITAYAFAVTLGLLLWGFDLVIVGTVSSIPAFQMIFGRQYEDRYIIPASWYAVWQISTNIGLMAGAVLSGWLQDRIGRRMNLLIGSLLCSVAVAICYISDLPVSLEARRGVFFLAKTVQGFAVGAIMCTTQTWLSEIVPVALRGPLMALFPIFKLLGQLIGALVCFSVIDSESRESYRLCFATQWPFSGLLTFIALLMPESPAWLLRKGRDTAASKSLLRLQGGRKGRSEQAAVAFRRLQDAIAREKQHSLIVKETYIDCFKGVQLRRTLLVCFAEFLPLLFGLQLLGSASYFLQQIGMDAETSVMFLVIGIALGTIASIFTFYSLSKFGRRTLVLFSMTIICFVWLGVGLSGIWQNQGAMWFTAVGCMVVVFTAGIGVWPASYAIGSEASALRLRSKTQGLGWFIYGLGTMVFGVVMPYIYNPDAGNGGSFSAFAYVGLSGIGAVVTFFYVPEMKGRSADEVDQMFDLRLQAREFKHWSDDGAAGITT